ncbi:ATP-binding protein [Longispora albida]|uniref:ATP-binding protein n=1 Tax=Longispora albida TaxID=203523 RepID=UPI0003A772AC|nr:ATP-binding protein [Longispora albida]
MSSGADKHAGLPRDRRNPAPKVAAWMQYQYDLAALVLLGHLSSEDVEGVVLERSTDFVILTRSGGVELVSVKHREDSRTSGSAWRWSDLRADRVLTDLHAKWAEHGRECSVAFWTCGGFSGQAHELWRATALRETPKPSLLKNLATELGTDLADAARFLRALHMPEDPLPRRKEIGDICVRRTADLLRPYRTGTDATAEACFAELRKLVRESSTDTEREGTLQAARAATLAGLAEVREVIRIRHEYAGRDDVLNRLLAVHDQLSAQAPRVPRPGWQPDPGFTGRAAELDELARLLRPGHPVEVAPVVVHGMTGVGKTSLALQFAALHSGQFAPVFINGTSRGSIEEGLAALEEPQPSGIAEVRGPVTAPLPGNSATLLVIDGVTDADAVLGLVPRSSLCRVIITSTATHLDHGYRTIELGAWPSGEATAYIARFLPGEAHAEAVLLASRLACHPLAITQAVNYCMSARRTLSDVLGRLASSPAKVLQQGWASGHPQTLLQSIHLNVDAVRERSPDSYDLLAMFAYMAEAPIDERLLERRRGTAFVLTPQASPPGPGSPAVTAQPPQPARRQFAVGVSQRAQASPIFSDDALDPGVIDALVSASLVSRSPGGVAVHPLIAIVMRALEPDPLPWLELGIGLFMKDLNEPSPNDVDRAVTQSIDHLAALALHAMELGHQGPGVITACVLVCRFLARAGKIAAWDSPAACAFALNAFRAAHDASNLGIVPFHVLMNQQRATAGALQANGQPDDAIALLRSIINLGRAYQEDTGDDTFHLSGWLDLGAVAAHQIRRSLAQEVLNGLRPWLDGERELEPSPQASVDHVHAAMLYLLGDTQQALNVSTSAFARPRVHEASDYLLADLHNNGVHIARDLGDHQAVLHHEMQILHYRKKSGANGLQEASAQRAAADGAIDARNYKLADELLQLAKPALEACGPRSRERAHYLATHGRLLFDQRSYSRALEDLSEAASIFTETGFDSDRGLLAAVHVHLAQAWAAHLQFSKAEQAIETAITIDTSLFGPDHGEVRTDLLIKADIQRMKAAVHQRRKS